MDLTKAWRAAQGRRRPWQVLLSAGLVGLVALLIAANESYLAVVVVVSILAIVGIFRFFFGSGRAFCVTLANLVAVYACLFLFFSQTNFAVAGKETLALAFVLPLCGFVAGSFRHRTAITRASETSALREGRDLSGVLFWLVPVFGIGALTFLVPGAGLSEKGVDATLLTACGAIGLVVYAVSRDVAGFLRDAGLLFDEFFRRIAGLVVPAFAFLTFYSLLVIMFAAFFSVIDHVTGGTSFRIDGVVRAISFPESLYFSLMTLSTVGYGDIAPASAAIRLVAAAEIVSGILLLLFGFNEIFSFSRDRDRER